MAAARWRVSEAAEQSSHTTAFQPSASSPLPGIDIPYTCVASLLEVAYSMVSHIISSGTIPSGY